MDTYAWAASLGVPIDDLLAPADGVDTLPLRTAAEAARRAVILHSVAAVGYDVECDPVVAWLNREGLWSEVSPCEKQFLENDHPAWAEKRNARWRQEAEWGLLWALGKVDCLGLPIRTCDTARLVDHIMPGLNDPITNFVASAKLRSRGEIFAEDDRVYNLHCYAVKSELKGDAPTDLLLDVLIQRRVALEWLTADVAWDDVTTDV